MWSHAVRVVRHVVERISPGMVLQSPRLTIFLSRIRRPLLRVLRNCSSSSLMMSFTISGSFFSSGNASPWKMRAKMRGKQGRQGGDGAKERYGTEVGLNCVQDRKQSLILFWTIYALENCKNKIKTLPETYKPSQKKTSYYNQTTELCTK